MTQVEQDLAYVQNVVKEAEDSQGAPRAIFFLWAAIYFVGFSLYDYGARYVGIFWTIAGPGGGAISYWLGHRWAIRAGSASRRLGMRHLLHWAGLMTAIFLALPLLWVGAISADAMAKIVLLIAAFGLFSAGIYLVRPYLWVGIALAFCYLATISVTNLPWTAVGAVSGGTMLLVGIFSNRPAE